jgi:hypothetical protein
LSHEKERHELERPGAVHNNALLREQVAEEVIRFMRLLRETSAARSFPEKGE